MKASYRTFREAVKSCKVRIISKQRLDDSESCRTLSMYISLASFGIGGLTVIKTSRISVLAATGRFSGGESAEAMSRPLSAGGKRAVGPAMRGPALHPSACMRDQPNPVDILGSMTGGLARLCELAFAPTSDIHVLASRVVEHWRALGPVAAGRTVALAAALALYLELCRRDVAESPTGALAAKDVEKILREAELVVPQAVLERQPALRRLLRQRLRTTAAA